jgi:CopG antitoxin of type II toxin-antitoxin system
MRKSNSRKTSPERSRGKNISRKSSVSQAATYAGIADFWDEHDLSDYWDKTRSVEANVELETEESLYAIEKGLSQTIRRAAKERGVSPHTLINLWLQEKIQKLKLSSRRG